MKLNDRTDDIFHSTVAVALWALNSTAVSPSLELVVDAALDGGVGHVATNTVSPSLHALHCLFIYPSMEVITAAAHGSLDVSSRFAVFPCRSVRR